MLVRSLLSSIGARAGFTSCRQSIVPVIFWSFFLLHPTRNSGNVGASPVPGTELSKRWSDMVSDEADRLGALEFNEGIRRVEFVTRLNSMAGFVVILIGCEKNA